jgi:AcrR family transcriptional regulator
MSAIVYEHIVEKQKTMSSSANASRPGEQSLKPRKTRKEILSVWRQGEVTEAARRIFARLGYSVASMDAIAKEAGMAKGTVYLYFRSKEHLFAAVLAHDLDHLARQIIEGMSVANIFADRLTLFLSLYCTYLQRNQDFTRILLVDSGVRWSRSTMIHEVIETRLLRVTEFMRRCLEQAIARKEIHDVPVDAAAFAIYDLARGLAERHLHGRVKLTLEQDLAFTHSLILRGLSNK